MASDLEMFKNFLDRAIQLGSDIENKVYPTLEQAQLKLARDILQKGNGYLLEYDTLRKHAEKGRNVFFQAGADVVVGNLSDSFSKSMQLKSASSHDPKSVDSHIKKALEQLSGEHNEKPRVGDRFVAKVVIMNSRNPWPGDILAPTTPVELATQSEARMRDLVRSVLVGQNSLLKKLTLVDMARHYNTFNKLQEEGGPHSSRLSKPTYQYKSTTDKASTGLTMNITKKDVPLKEELVVKVYFPERELTGLKIHGGIYRIYLKYLGNDAFLPVIHYTHITH